MDSYGSPRGARGGMHINELGIEDLS